MRKPEDENQEIGNTEEPLLEGIILAKREELKELEERLVDQVYEVVSQVHGWINSQGVDWQDENKQAVPNHFSSQDREGKPVRVVIKKSSYVFTPSKLGIELDVVEYSGSSDKPIAPGTQREYSRFNYNIVQVYKSTVMEDIYLENIGGEINIDGRDVEIHSNNGLSPIGKAQELMGKLKNAQLLGKGNPEVPGAPITFQPIPQPLASAQ